MTHGTSFRDPRYLILIIFIGISAIVSLGGYVYYEYRKELLREEKLNDLKAIADLKENMILQWKEERMADASIVTDNPFIRKNLIRVFPEINPSFLPIFKGYLIETQHDFGYSEIFVVSIEGKILFSTNPDEQLPDPVIHKYLDIVRHDTTISFSGFELDHNHIPYLNLLVPFFHDDDCLGFIALRIDPQQYLFPLIQTWPTPSKSSETLICSVIEDTVVFINELRQLPQSAFKLKIPLTQKKVAAVMAVDGVRGFVEAYDYMDNAIIAYLKKIPGTEWYMIAKTDQDELFEPMQRETILISIIIILFLLFIGITSYMVLRNYMDSFFIKKVHDELGLKSTTDISDRKRYEHQIQKLNRLYSTLFNINQIIYRVKDKHNMMQGLCDILIEKGGYRMVSVEEFSEGKRNIISSAGHIEGYFDNSPLVNDDTLNSIGPAGVAFKTQKSIVCQDIDTDPLMAPWRDESLHRGYRSSAAFPIIARENVISVLNIYSATIDWFDTEEIFLLDQLSHDIGYALGVLVIEEESKEVRQELETAEKKFSQVFVSMNDGIAIHELVFNEIHEPVDYRILDVNPMFEKITSISSEAAIGALCSVLYQVSPPPFFEQYKEVALTGESATFETFFEPMGKYFRISVFSQDKNGFTTVFQNITEQIEAREYLKRMNTELEKRVLERTTLLETANRELESFAYSVSHDLKTPLRSISGFSTILKDKYSKALDEEGNHFLTNIIQAGKNMNQLIEDLLRYSRLGQAKQELTSVDLRNFFKSCLSEIQPLIESTNAKIVLPTQTLFVKGNILMLNQIFTNLIVNGLHYQPTDHKPEIDISWSEQGSHVIVSVKDNGIGIDKRFFKKIFQMFQRLHREDQYQGTGIGLAIVKKAAEILDGEVWVSDSEKGSGTTFCVKLIKSDML